MNATGSQPNAPAVNVIVPIYKNLAVTRNCLESLGTHPTPDNTRVTLILDGSPEDALVEYCQRAAEKFDFDIIVNKENQGFVKTANEGMQLHSDNDVVLLNSDTVVSGNWLNRLRSSAYQKESIGTVTPFSNNATICSYPVFPCANALPPNWSIEALDKVFKSANANEQHPIPTAVGFCMYIKRACLEDVGLFDEDNFGLGYGEECDFSLRAANKGWSHMLAADVFVYHEGGASFSSESDARKSAADEVIAKLHPEYDNLVTSFIHNDPLANLRAQVDQQRILERPSELQQILTERSEQAKTLRAGLAKERENTELTIAEVRKLEQFLDHSRGEFQAADRALKTTQATLDKAHKALDTLGESFNRVQDEGKVLHEQTQQLAGEIDTLGEQLYLSREEAGSLKDRLEQIYASRSWRYTKWMRKEK